MKKIFFLLLVISHYSIAQTPGEWTWMHGDTIGYQPGIYGIQGVSAPGNRPGARYESSEFRDNAGNFWLFGGSGNDAIGSLGFLQDLWKYNPSTNEWTWVNGSDLTGAQSSYGNIGVPSPTNQPQPSYAFPSWTDNNGNFWIFGGYSNSLWNYNVATNEWTWMNGDSTGAGNAVYGTKGVSSPLNTPGYKNENAATWVDKNNNLWLFGGFGSSAAGTGALNDLWKYDISTNEWTWVSGDNSSNPAAVYGTLGVSNATNKPGGRYCYCSWKDTLDNLFLFGGYTGGYRLNDMWKYNIATNEWTWVNGSNNTSTTASGTIGGAACSADNSFTPGRRFENRIRWTDDCGNFWLYGGFDRYCDLWVYNPYANQWSYVNGDSAAIQAGVYNAQGVSTPANSPGYRFGGLPWKDNAGNLWMFGGASGATGDLNDLWRFVPDPNCKGCATSGLPSANFTLSDSAICPNSCIDFTNLSANATSWQWNFFGGTPPSSTAQDPTNICYNTAGTYDVTLIAVNANGSDTIQVSQIVTVYPQPIVPSITQVGDTLFSSSGYVSYQWFYGSDSIPGATDYDYIATQDGNYNLVVTDSNGCSVGAGIINVIAGSVENIFQKMPVQIFPNPSSNSATLVIDNSIKLNDAKLTVYNLQGEELFTLPVLKYRTEISWNKLESGMYFYKLFSNEQSAANGKIIICR